MNNKKKKIKRVIFAYYLTIERWKIKWSRNSLSKKKKKKTVLFSYWLVRTKKYYISLTKIRLNQIAVNCYKKL